MFYLELGLLPFREIIRQRRLNFLHYILAQDVNSVIYKVFEEQSKERHKNDWVSSVVRDLDEIKLNVTFVEIQKTSKMIWRNTVRKFIEENAFRKLENVKYTHSKVKDLKHTKLRIQEYFLPNGIMKITKEDVQLVFKMRCKVTIVKMNLKGQYENFECEACLLEEESQEHVYKCEEILKQQNDKPEYERIMWGNVNDKIKVAKIFNEKINILKTIRERKISHMAPGDRFDSCLQYCKDTDWKYI